ncbi:30S ribosomal protein S20 [Myxococcota bacterium]|nr:30S ribosomal protein S20 [Myxococcota bacterium]
MATHKSAKKRARQDLKRRARNRSVMSSVRTAVKKFRSSLSGEDTGATEAALRQAEGMIRRSVSKGVTPRKRASRQISRLTRERNRSLTPS